MIKSKRFRYAIGIITVNILIGLLALIMGSDLIDAGIALLLINGPFYVFIVGDAIRPAKDRVNKLDTNGIKADLVQPLVKASKRFRFAMLMTMFNYIVIIIAISMLGDVYGVGMFLSMINSPIYAYILGDSFRPTYKPGDDVLDDRFRKAMNKGEPDITIENVYTDMREIP